MMNERVADSEHFVTIRAGEWRFQDQRGVVDASIPVACIPSFSELAVLVLPGVEGLRYAARVGDTEYWAHFYHLQPWMYPFVQKLLRASSRYDHIVALLDNAHRFLHDGDPT